MTTTHHELVEVDRRHRTETTRLASEIRRLDAAMSRLERTVRSQIEWVFYLVLMFGFSSTLVAALAIRRL